MENSTGAFKAASVSDPLLRDPILSNRTSEGGSWGKTAEERAIARKEVKSEC